MKELTITDVLGLPITDAAHVLQEINTMRAVQHHLQQDFYMRKLKRERVKNS
jgi:hypothetical protein